MLCEFISCSLYSLCLFVCEFVCALFGLMLNFVAAGSGGHGVTAASQVDGGNLNPTYPGCLCAQHAEDKMGTQRINSKYTIVAHV